MDFHEILEIARIKQQKHNKEVKKIEELHERKTKMRMDEYAKSRSIANPVKLRDCKKTTNDVSHPKQFSLPKDLVQRSRDNRKGLSDQQIKRPCDNINNSGGVASSCPATSEPVDKCITQKNSTKANRCTKPSFSDILEMAKKNVQHDNVKKQAFDDLIPCTPTLRYRDFNSSSSNQPVKTVSSCVQSQVRLPPSINKGNSTRSSELRTSGKRSSPIDGTKKLTGVSSTSGHSIAAPDSGRGPHTLKVADRISKCAVSVQRQNGVQKSGAPSSASSALSKSNPTINTSGNARLVVSNSKGKMPAVVQNRSFVSKTVNSSTSEQSNVRNSTENVSRSGKARGQPVINKSNDHLPSKVVGRGIAAQLGVCSQPKAISSHISSEEDDYESDDSFIDDSEVVESNEYARVVRDVHKALRFDPRKYKDVNPWDDLRSMEANYRDIEKEEKRSARIAALEDAIELERDMERKKRKLLKSKP